VSNPFEIKKRSTRGAGSLMERPAGSNKWHLSYYVPEYDPVSGKTRSRRVKEYCGLPKAKAQDLLILRMADVKQGKEPDAAKPRTVGELFHALHLFTTNNAKPGGRTAKGLEWRWQHLCPFFAHIKAPAVTTAHVEQYKAKRLAEGAAPATVNRELAVLRRMFNYGRKKCTPPLVHSVPPIELFKEYNTRTGFVEDAQFARIAEEANKEEGVWCRLFVECAYSWGWRKAELLGLRVRNVDLQHSAQHSAVRLDPGTTKNGEGREAAMTDKLFELFAMACAGKKPSDAVFTRENGRPVKGFAGTWRNLCVRAGVPGLLVHDFRRSAARQLRKAGVAESIIMKTGGWKTASMFRRYAIVSSEDQKNAMQALEKSRRQEQSQFSPSEPLTAKTDEGGKEITIQ
jgi:integrase